MRESGHILAQLILNVSFPLQTASDAAAPAHDEDASRLRRALQTKADSYTSTSHVTESSGAGVFVKDGNYVIVLTGEKTNLKNFWSGKWQSTWTLKVDGTSAELSGDAKVSARVTNAWIVGQSHTDHTFIQLHVHYFEDGNLQMQSSKSSPATTFSFSSPEKLAEETFSRIQVMTMRLFARGM